MTSKFALVIANTEYQDASFAKLTAPGKDAEEFAQVLRDAELAAFEDVQVLLNEGESKIRRSIARFFADRKRDDLLLLYFSGHGIRNGQGQLFLAANDTEISILEATGIPADFITYAMNNSRSQRQLLILDCCNSGAFAYGSKSASAVGQSMGMATAFEGSGFGRVVLTATDATQYAWEGDKVIGNTQKSVFTHFLIEGLKGDADRDGDGRIHVDELYDYAYEQVVRRTPKQTPGKWSYKQQGDIVLRENLKTRDVKPAPLPPDLLELLSHPNSGVRKVGIQELISLLEGKHLGLTRAAEEKLREIANNDDSFTLRKTASETLIAHGLAVEEPTPPPVITPPIARVETTILKEEKSEIEKLESQAIPYNLKGELRPKPVTVVPSGQIAKPAVKKAISSRLLGFAAAGLLIIVLLIWGTSNLLRNPPTGTPALTSTSQSSLILASQLSTTVIDQPIKTETTLPTQTSISLTETVVPVTSALGIGSTMTGKDGMTLLYVPAGNFTMGSPVGMGDDDEHPQHTVYLDAFWIDKTEVTNKLYALCVTAGQCKEPFSKKSFLNPSYYGDSAFDNYPVIYVDWNMARAYCEWAKRRLPTEAEWEKAARGTDARTYPWGNEKANNNMSNYGDTIGDTSEVNKYSDGASPYGALNMAGNVWEWVMDWYGIYYYSDSPMFNPPGPVSGQTHVLRGGSWLEKVDYIRSAQRIRPSRVTSGADKDRGFRCGMSATP